MGGVGTGFALAVRPISAETIRTGTEGLEAGEVQIPVGTREKIAGYRAMPAKRKGKAPVVLVVHEIFGIHEHIKDVCRRLGRWGYFAVAPDLFGRHGDVSKLSDFNEIRTKVVSKVSDTQVLADLRRALACEGLRRRRRRAAGHHRILLGRANRLAVRRRRPPR